MHGVVVYLQVGISNRKPVVLNWFVGWRDSNPLLSMVHTDTVQFIVLHCVALSAENGYRNQRKEVNFLHMWYNTEEQIICDVHFRLACVKCPLFAVFTVVLVNGSWTFCRNVGKIDQKLPLITMRFLYILRWKFIISHINVVSMCTYPKDKMGNLISCTSFFQGVGISISKHVFFESWSTKIILLNLP